VQTGGPDLTSPGPGGVGTHSPVEVIIPGCPAIRLLKMESGIPILWFTGGAGTFAEMTRAVPNVITMAKIKTKTVFLFMYFLLVYFLTSTLTPRLSIQEIYAGLSGS
jgi:hypothetical protein